MDGYVFKVDSLGNLIWEQIYGGLSIDGFSSITKKNEEYGYILFGHTKSYMLDKSRKKKKGFIGRIIASMFKKEPSSEALSTKDLIRVWLFVFSKLEISLSRFIDI